MAQSEIVVWRRIWKEGKDKYIIQIPKAIVRHFNLQGKFVKATLQVIEDETDNSNNT